MNTDKQWEKWGQANPYFGVLSDKKFRGKNLSDDILDDFSKSGEQYIASVIGTALDFQDSFSPNRVLDFGCGVGRLLVPLAERFNHVVGVDISPSMLAEAQKHVARFGDRVTLCQSDDDLTRVEGDFDFIHSVIVFQHISKNRGMYIVNNLLSRLNPGGMAALHFPYRRNVSPFSKMVNFFRRYIPGVHQAVNIFRGLPFNDPIMEMNCYDITKLLATFHNHGIDGAYLKIHPELSGYQTATFFGIKRISVDAAG